MNTYVTCASVEIRSSEGSLVARRSLALFAVVGTALGVGKIQELPDSAMQCDTGVFKSVLPPFAKTSAQAFIEQATLIDQDRLWKQAELYLDDHWKARDARLHERSLPIGIDIEIVQEQHHAINWITGYGDLP